MTPPSAARGRGFPVVVVGAGVIGAAVAHELTRRGVRPLVVEQGERHSWGATGSSGGMVRGYDPDPVTAARARESILVYRDAARWPGGVSPLAAVGALTIADERYAASLAAAVDALPAGTARLESAREVLGVRLAGGVALVEPSAGWVDPRRVTEVWLAQAVRAGAELILRRRVADVTEVRGRPAVTLDSGERIGADAVVLTRGAWSAAGLPGPGPGAGRTRSIQVAVVRHPAPGLRHATFVDLRTGAYGRPAEGDASLIGLPHEVWDVDPDGPHPPSAEHTRRVYEAVAANLPWVKAARTLRTVRSFDGYDAADAAVVRATAVPGVWGVRGWNGGGVKVAPAVGRYVARHVLRHHPTATRPPAPSDGDQRKGTP